MTPSALWGRIVSRRPVLHRPAYTEAAHALCGYLELTKPRIALLLVLVSVAAFWVAAGGQPDPRRLAAMAAGVSLLAAGIFALNQYLERDIDALMPRTESRPLPAQRIQPADAARFGAALCAASVAVLASAVNPLTAALAVATAASYLLLYTPLKRKTPHCTLVGAFPGATPPLFGWAAATGELGAGAWVLFGILFLWQFPHFHAIAALYRGEYARAGVRLWTVVEPSGRTTAVQIVASAVLLLGVSALPAFMGLSGSAYLAGSFVLGAAFLWLGVRWAHTRSPRRAQQLLLASVVYLPVLLALLVIDQGSPR